MPVPFWDDAPGQWDTVVIAKKKLPGTCELSGSVGRKLDFKKEAGSDGATLSDLGYEPADIDIKLRLWTREHFDTWQQVVKLIQPRPGKGAPAPVDISHPALAVHGVRRVYVKKVGFLKRSSTAGVYETTVSCLEWRPSSPAKTNTPASSIDEAYNSADIATKDAQTPPVQNQTRTAP